MTSRCPKNPATGVSAGRHLYTPAPWMGLTDGRWGLPAAKWHVCDYCGKRIRYQASPAVEPRAPR